MKIFLLILFIFLTGCSKQEVVDEVKGVENKIEASSYQDNNKIKISLYTTNTKHMKQTEITSKFLSLKDIGTFTSILSNENVEIGSCKTLYKKYASSYENFTNYKIGYEIIVNLKDNTSIKETILKPKYFTDYSFSNYLYIWLYDDINTTGWHSHIEEKDYNNNTVMSSIKLMATEEGSNNIENILITVFTYDNDDFDLNGNYRGISKSTLIIKKGN